MEEEGEKSEKRIGPDLPNSTNYEFSGGFRFRSGKDLRNYFSNCHRGSRAVSVFPTDSRVWGLAAQPENDAQYQGGGSHVLLQTANRKLAIELKRI